MITDIVELLVYASALDAYRRANMNSGAGWRALDTRIRGKRVGSALLDVVDWNARPLLARECE